jgi:putative oxidoreductase
MKKVMNWILSVDSIRSSGIFMSIGLLLLRVGVGLMMAFGHGWSKFINYGARSANFADPFGIGTEITLGLVIFAELFCAIALVFGFFSRAVTIPLIINMTMAALVIHGGDPFARKELALMYLASFITIFVIGPGRYSIDGLLTRRKYNIERAE